MMAVFELVGAGNLRMTQARRAQILLATSAVPCHTAKVEPWAKLKKNSSEEDKREALRELLVMAEGLANSGRVSHGSSPFTAGARIAAVLLSPVTPQLSRKILDEFGVSSEGWSAICSQLRALLLVASRGRRTGLEPNGMVLGCEPPAAGELVVTSFWHLLLHVRQPEAPRVASPSPSHPAIRALAGPPVESFPGWAEANAGFSEDRPGTLEGEVRCGVQVVAVKRMVSALTFFRMPKWADAP